MTFRLISLMAIYLAIRPWFKKQTLLVISISLGYPSELEGKI